MGCNVPVKICSCHREKNSDEYGDGLQHQTVDCEAEDCNDPVKICSCYREENSDEYDDGRQHQAVDVMTQ